MKTVEPWTIELSNKLLYDRADLSGADAGGDESGQFKPWSMKMDMYNNIYILDIIGYIPMISHDIPLWLE